MELKDRHKKLCEKFEKLRKMHNNASRCCRVRELEIKNLKKTIKTMREES